MKEGLTKKESAFLKGLALWMMIYHHRFINQIWTLDLEFQAHFTFLLSDEFTRIVAWFCKIALSLMTFVSGYGVCYIFKKSNKEKVTTLLLNDYKSVVKRLIPFYGRYWYAFVVWTIADLFIMKIKLENPEYLMNALGLSYSLNGSWWYVLQYVEMMLLAPVMDLYFTKHGKKKDILKWGVLILLGLLIILIPGGRAFAGNVLDITSFQISYMAIFVVGYMVAKWNIFGIIRTWFSKRNAFIHYGICIVGLVSIMAIRIYLSERAGFAAYCRTDFIIAPIWILFLCEILSLGKIIGKSIVDFFGWFSKYSMYIWVLHLIFMDKFFHSVTMITGLALGNYLTIVLFTTIASVVLERIEHYVLGFIKNSKSKANHKE